MRLSQWTFAALFLSAGAALADALTVNQTTRLINLAESHVADAKGWAMDLHDVLHQLQLERSRENICATIAVIDQESGFVADPEVPNLGKISEKAIQERLNKIPVAGTLVLRWLENVPTGEVSFMSRLRAARTERDLDLAYRALVEYMGKITSMDTIIQLGLLNTLIEERNEIDTAGSMQVSVKFAIEETRKLRWLPMTLHDIYALRDQLYTRRGGMYFGVKQLLDYETGYSSKLYRFADYNAGRYASRNAAFQHQLTLLTGRKLALDGDLLSYGKDGKVLAKVTETEAAVRAAAKRHALHLTDQQIRADLLKEKERSFTSTRTFVTIRDRATAVSGKAVAFARMPEIMLDSRKLSRPFTTRRFAENVNRRYRACMAAKL